MGFDASVYVIYGIEFTYSDSGDIERIIKLMVPDLVEEYGVENTFRRIDTDLSPRTNGYYLVRFENSRYQYTGKFYLALWIHEHSVVRRMDAPKPMPVPSPANVNKFKDWCRANDIDTSTLGYYTAANGG